MSHYTLTSGRRTQTITSRCPICLKITYHTSDIQLTDTSVCCNNLHAMVYTDTLHALWSRAMRWAIDHNIRASAYDIFDRYMIEVGK